MTISNFNLTMAPDKKARHHHVFVFFTLFWKRHKCTKLKLVEQLMRDRGREVFTVLHGRHFNTRPTYTQSVLSFEAAGHCALGHTTHWFKRKCSHNYCKQPKKHHSCRISKIRISVALLRNVPKSRNNFWAWRLECLTCRRNRWLCSL